MITEKFLQNVLTFVIFESQIILVDQIFRKEDIL